MALKIRLARRGAKKKPFYHIVLADARAPRDGNYLVKLGYYNPMVDVGVENRIKLETDLIKEWLAKGAQPTERVSKILGQAGIIEMPKFAARPIKSAPGKKALDRAEEKVKKAASAKAAAEEAKNAPAPAVEAEVEAPAAE